MNEGKKENAPGIIVILGATGDLAAKKLFPSLWHLFRHGRLPERLSVVGVARRTFSDAEFQALVRESIDKRGGTGGDESLFARFLATFSYHTGSFDNEEAFQSLAKLIEEKERTWGLCGNKLFYMAVPPTSYESILKNLASARLNVPCGGEFGWSRVLVEKPFGSDEKSAGELQKLLTSYFQENQIYRIDHYLFKEIVQGIEHFRFSNNLFEHSWDRETIERIDIRLLESIGVEDRGVFYDGVGTLRDVGQNHLLVMLAAITMDLQPSHDDVEALRRARADILRQFKRWSYETLTHDTYRAQYEGYQDIEGVAQDSQIETYFALKTELTHPRWAGVPIILEAGKGMREARKEIVLTLKHPKTCLLCETGAHGPNIITFRLEPNDEIVIYFWTKKPGFERVLEKRSFSFFLHEKETKIQYVEEYGKVLNAALRGDQSLFVSTDEIVEMWRFTDPIVQSWRENSTPLERYTKGLNPEPALLSYTTDTEESLPGVVGMIGLGKMGANLARQLHEKSWRVVGYDPSPEAVHALAVDGLSSTNSLSELVGMLVTPRTLWLMVPHEKVDSVIEELLSHLNEGDTIIDGGNSPYKESIRRAEFLQKKGIHFLDVGVSGGPEGARMGACLMIGGEKGVYDTHKQLFRDVAVRDGYQYLGKSGAGHFVKMIHNGIEYGMMESIAEGFHIMKRSDFALALADVADLYQHQSVITSRLIGWLKKGFEKHGEELDGVDGSAGASGEGAWTIEAAKEIGVDVGAIEHALQVRIESQKNPNFAGKLIQTMRNMFGGHSIEPRPKEKDI